MEWEVWLADGSTRDSSRYQWDDDWDGVLVMRWWKGAQKGICWGDSNYGLHQTVKGGALVSDEAFFRALESARRVTTRPSER